MPSTVPGIRKSSTTTTTVRRFQGIRSRPGNRPTTEFIHKQPSVRNAPRPNSGPITRRGSALSASRPPSTLPRQIPPSMMPMTLVQTINEAPTCRATSRLATSSSTMMHRLAKKERT